MYNIWCRAVNWSDVENCFVSSKRVLQEDDNWGTKVEQAKSFPKLTEAKAFLSKNEELLPKRTKAVWAAGGPKGTEHYLRRFYE